MSGSGSAIFALVADDDEAAAVGTVIREAWGQHTWLEQTHLIAS
jgi:4-diphosphocytidyl-2C-methyl-D-erythritol kinase